MKLLGFTFLEWEHITRHDTKNYLDRFIIIKCSLFGLFYHIFSDSDDECLHDHPWNFWSFIVKGGYWEKTTNGKLTWYKPGSLLYRPANWTHRVVLAQNNNEVIKAHTIVFHTKKIKSWGFFVKNKWIHWRKYNHAGMCGE